MLACAEDAVARIGLDVEPLSRPIGSALLEAALAPEEATWVASLPSQVRGAAFLTLWTLKESILKGASTGLSQPPGSVVIDAVSPRPLRLPLLNLDRSARALDAAATGHGGAIATSDMIEADARRADG